MMHVTFQYFILADSETNDKIVLVQNHCIFFKFNHS